MLLFWSTYNIHVYIYYVISGDLGGYLGLLLGASVVTVCEILDVILYNIASYSLKKREKRRQIAEKQPKESQGPVILK